MSGINSAHAPEIDLPGRFMVFAMLNLLVVALLAPWGVPLLLEGFYAPRLLAFVHLNTLGVIAAVIVGASYQLVPVVLQTPLASVRLGRLSFWVYIAGYGLFLPGILTTWRPALGLGATLLFAGLGLYLTVIAGTLLQAPRLDVVGWHVAASLAGLGGGVSLGLLLGLNKGTGFLGSLSLRLLAGHATLMLAGWVLILLAGVAYRLVGMFTLSEDRLRARLAWLELGCSTSGAWVLALALIFSAGRAAMLAGALALLAGQSLFGWQLVHLYRARRRRGFDVHIPFALLAALGGILAALLLMAGITAGARPESSIWVLVVWSLLAMVALTAIQGFFYKISTFLVWLRRYAPLAGRQRVPRLEEMYARRLASAGWLLWVAGLAVSFLAVALAQQRLAQFAGLLLAIGLACFLVNVARIARHVRADWNFGFRSAAGLMRSGTRQKGSTH